MAIRIDNVEQVLQECKAGPFTLVDLHALSTVREPYLTLLLQPRGVVEANQERVGHADRAYGTHLCSGFLNMAVAKHADLAIAPEYCVPWDVVEDIAVGTFRPAPGCLWILGCESIRPADFLIVAQRCNAEAGRVLLHEDLDERQMKQKRYLDPLVYVFWATDAKGASVLCFLVQFKTVACRDFRDVEQTSLCLGRSVYAFNRGLGKIGLLSIICSDAFDFTPLVENVHQNCLLIHIQLNPKPAHSDYAAYRMKLCSVGTHNNVELICLNWAQNVQELQSPGKYVEWNNVAGSAWYVPPAKFSGDGALVEDLHHHGLYYSLLKRRWHAFFLNYDEQVLLVQKQKLLFPGDQALAPKSCLAVIERWSWDPVTKAWNAGCLAGDGFAVVLQPYAAIAGPLELASQQSALAVERALEVLVGPAGNPTTWFAVHELEAMHLHLDEESMCRVTVHQEADPARPGVIFRKRRLQRAQDAVTLPGNGVPWPAPVRDLEQGFALAWMADAPHHNVVPLVGGRGSAALVYLADEADDAAIERVQQRLRLGLRTHAATNSLEKTGQQFNDAMVRSLDRLCIVFKRGPVYGARGPEGLNVFDRPPLVSPVDIAGDSR